MVFIGEMVAGRVGHRCHEPTFVTTPFVADLASRRGATIWATVNRCAPVERLPLELGYDTVDQPGVSVIQTTSLIQFSGKGANRDVHEYLTPDALLVRTHHGWPMSYPTPRTW